MAVTTTLTNVKTRTLQYKVFLGKLTMTGTGEYTIGGLTIPAEILASLRALNNKVDFVTGVNADGDHLLMLNPTANKLVILYTDVPGTNAWTELADSADLPVGVWDLWVFSNKNLEAEVPPLGRRDRT